MIGVHCNDGCSFRWAEPYVYSYYVTVMLSIAGIESEAKLHCGAVVSTCCAAGCGGHFHWSLGI